MILTDNVVIGITGFIIASLLMAIVWLFRNWLESRWNEYKIISREREKKQELFNTRIESAVDILVRKHNEIERDVIILKEKVK